MTPLPIVAVVGRPNVGKSTLFNRIVGHRAAIVEDRARTTRDRIYGEAEWNGRRFIAVDTGGLEIKPGDPIEEKVQEQARIAIAEADAIVLVVDSISGLTPADIEAADLLRTAKAPVLVAANKADNDKRELEAAEFYSLGWEETHPISAAHGRGVADLLDAIVWALPPESPEEIERKRREAEADDWAREMAEGRLARVRDGDAEAIEIDGDEARRGRPAELRRRGREGVDRPGRAAERRQVEPVQLAARRGPGDRQRHTRHDARRDRHAPAMGPQRHRPDRHRRHAPPRQSGQRPRRGALLDAASAQGRGSGGRGRS